MGAELALGQAGRAGSLLAEAPEVLTEFGRFASREQCATFS